MMNLINNLAISDISTKVEIAILIFIMLIIIVTIVILTIIKKMKDK